MTRTYRRFTVDFEADAGLLRRKQIRLWARFYRFALRQLPNMIAARSAVRTGLRRGAKALSFQRRQLGGRGSSGFAWGGRAIAFS